MKIHLVSSSHETQMNTDNKAKEKIPIPKGRNILFPDYDAIKLEINYQFRKKKKNLPLF